jgi:hypothetical protein
MEPPLPEIPLSISRAPRLESGPSSVASSGFNGQAEMTATSRHGSFSIGDGSIKLRRPRRLDAAEPAYCVM